MGPVDGDDSARALQVPVVRDGSLVAAGTVEEARSRRAQAIAELPRHALKLSPGDPAIETVWDR
jgi:nicotinate phosphoribosyltransferase